MVPPVPNLAVIGAQKAGTTSLHAALSMHPEIFMSHPIKEANFFYPEKNIETRIRNYGFDPVTSRTELLERYMLEGYRGERYIGESPTDYTISNWARAREVPTRMKDLSPDIRLLYIVRNPYARILSAIGHRLKGRDTAVYNDLRGNNNLGWPVYVGPSLYHYQVSAYYEVFDPSQIMIVGFEEFIADQNATMQAVFRFLDLEGHILDQAQHLNVAKKKSASRRQGLPRDYVARISDMLREEMTAFQTLTGFPTDQWDLDPETWTEPKA